MDKVRKDLLGRKDQLVPQALKVQPELLALLEPLDHRALKGEGCTQRKQLFMFEHRQVALLPFPAILWLMHHKQLLAMIRMILPSVADVLSVLQAGIVNLI